MKKHLLLIVILISCFSVACGTLSKALAQDPQLNYTTHIVKWYEDLNSIAKKYNTTPEAILQFNGMDDANALSWKQELKIPIGGAKVPTPDSVQLDTEAQPPVSAQEQVQGEAEISASMVDTTAFYRISDIASALLLPLNSTAEVSEGYYDFYSGALLACRDLAAEGIVSKLKVIDIASGKIDLSEEDFKTTDVVIGPVAPEAIESLLKIRPEHKFIVSPMDPRGSAIAQSENGVIQAPSSTEHQYNDMVSWLSEEYEEGDKVLLFTEKGAKASNVATVLENSGIKYETISYDILQGRDITENLPKHMSTENANRVIIASDSEAFVNDVVRNLNLAIHLNFKVVLYAPSKFRNFETIEVLNYHNLSMRLSTSYFVDYDNSKVKSFLLNYRALFNAEPGPYAFQGYDLTSFFLKKCSELGPNWAYGLKGQRSRGLQSDFNFEVCESGSLQNVAVRRVVYNPDFSIVLL